MGEARAGHIHKLQTIMLVLSMLELEGIDTMEGKWTSGGDHISATNIRQRSRLTQKSLSRYRFLYLIMLQSL